MSRHLARRCVIAAAGLAMVPLASSPGVAAPRIHGSHPTSVGRATQIVGSRAFTHASRVRLITGDAVRVLSRADGRSVATILPGSPHAGAPVARVQTGTQSYVLPRTRSFERKKLDLSLFDVTALAALHGGRVPITVRFLPHATPRPMPGLMLRLGSARARVGSTVVRGSYSARDFRGLSPHELAGIASVRLAEPLRKPSVAGPTHALTVRVATGSGRPASGVVVLIENVDDASFVESPSTDDSGQVTVDVPEGHYSALGFTFSRLVIAPEFGVTSDRTVDLDLGDATIKPQVTLPGYRVLDTALSVARSPENGFMFPLTFDGPRFFMRVQPTRPYVHDGAVLTGVSATLTPRGTGSAPAYDRLAVSGDVSRGVPDDLTFTHHRRDFARVVDVSHANGPAGLRQTMVGASGSAPNSYIDMFTGHELDTRVPGRRIVLFQASPRVFYQQTLFPQAPPDSEDLTQLITGRRYLQPGTAYRETFARGPVGPGTERRILWWFGGLTRHSDRLTGSLPLFDGAGSSMESWVDPQDGHWTLRSGNRVLAHGRGDISPHVALPLANRAYVLTAISRPASQTWRLSTDVRDEWAFRSRHGRSAIGILAPSYVPPLSMNGDLRRGWTSFALSLRSTLGRSHRVVDVHLLLSTDDGHTWRDARLTRTSGTTFRVRYWNPAAHGSNRFMSMRVTGADTSGNAVTETAMRVYRLR